MAKPTHIPRLKIIEAIPPNSRQGQEKTILTEFLQMEDESYKPLRCDPFVVDNRYKGDNLKTNFLDFLFKHYSKHRPSKKRPLVRRYRYVHISSHGDGDSLTIGPDEDVHITPGDMCTYCGQDKIPLRGALITLSACGSLLGEFAEALASLGANAVIRPLNTVSFQESAMFFMLFYFILSRHTGILKRNDEDDDGKRIDDRKRIDTSIRIAEYIDIYQKTKMSYLNIGGTGTYRLDYWIRSKKGKEHAYLF